MGRSTRRKSPDAGRLRPGWLVALLTLTAVSCHRPAGLPVVGFLDFVEDATLEQARNGFFDALRESGFSDSAGTLQVIRSNAQGDIPTLGQACDLLVARRVDLIAANTTLSTITAVQRTKDIPVCMMVAPRPDLAGLSDSPDVHPDNLFGVYETLEYIDTSVAIIRELMPRARRVGTVFNQSEPQSRDAFARLETQCVLLGLDLVSLPVNNSSETQLVTAALLDKGIDVFFALPDNVIFASFETVVKSCDGAGVPVFTSEAGLVNRGAVASFGADFYAWGRQAGEQAAAFLKSGATELPHPEIVAVRHRVFNPAAAARYGLIMDAAFRPVVMQ